MSVEEALALIDMVLSRVPATREEHARLSLAVQVLKQAATKDEKKK